MNMERSNVGTAIKSPKGQTIARVYRFLELQLPKSVNLLLNQPIPTPKTT